MVNQFLKFGDTRSKRGFANIRKRKKGKRNYNDQSSSTRWDIKEMKLMKGIVDNEPDFYLEEIQEDLFDLGGG